MLSRLQICLAQLKAGNNSEKLKNEIRQRMYSLYKSKKLTKKYFLNNYLSLHYLNMETIFKNNENSKTNEPHRFKLDLTDKLNFKDPRKNMANNNKFKISSPTWNETFDLPDGFYSIADIQDYFEFIIKFIIIESTSLNLPPKN